ncbi:hypothetical protein SAMN05421879_1435 [Ornithinimicrobium cerasi]|uniref:Uncharacterized protein n=1 Tax=Ornithinimicrobium cerasi TaxID=2248773 RepID=A0A285VYX0_9MICO|nr:hypothetical protein SAMN05421879_1435 [Ornithinimicrobium cerasi]
MWWVLRRQTFKARRASNANSVNQGPPQFTLMPRVGPLALRAFRLTDGTYEWG